MLSRLRHAGIKTIGLLAALALGAGLLSAVAALPVIGVAGIAVKNAAQTFNDLPVAGLGQVPSKTQILDRSGHVIAIYYPRGIYRDPVRWHQIAPVMKNAIVAIEDYRFWKHGAFDLHGTLRAVYSDLSGNQVQGGLRPGPAVRQERLHPDREDLGSGPGVHGLQPGAQDH